MEYREHWYKNAIIYGVDVSTFQDSNGDGIGDFPGLTSRLEYLAGLGVNCLWLLPFYPSPGRDNGYDVMDYFGVDPRLGTPGDFVECLREAHGRGIRVIVDLVVNHTSDQHPWFQSARQSADSPYRDFYVWTDDPEPPPPGKGNIFAGQEQGVWTYDDAAQLYYYHRFYDFEPGLRLANPEVRQAIMKIMGFWLQLGVDGFRIDAASHMVEQKGLATTEPDDPHEIFREMRTFAALRKGDVALLAEADVSPDKVADFFGRGDEMNLLFNFLLDNHFFLALARESAEPLEYVLTLLPSIPEAGQWANFIRNLDELDLERLNETQREEVFRAFAPKEEMRIFGRGVRRRFAPMLRGDQARLRLAYSLLFSIPGSPVIVYGDEIGMGDDLDRPGRAAVRTAMQWSSAANAGFSTAESSQLAAPVIARGKFGYRKVNVAQQQRDEDTLLAWMHRLIRVRKEHPAIGWGTYTVIDTPEPSVFAHRCDGRDGTVLAVHNLSRSRAQVEIAISKDEAKQLVPIFGDHGTSPGVASPLKFELDGYGYRWYAISQARRD